MSPLLVIYKGNSNWNPCSDILGSVLKGGKTFIKDMAVTIYFVSKRRDEKAV